jgi:hypothetical protein
MGNLLRSSMVVAALALAACNPNKAQAPSQPAASAPPAPKVLPPKDAIPIKPGAYLDWTTGPKGAPKVYTADGWTITLSSIDKEDARHPVLTVVDDQGRKISVVGEPGSEVASANRFGVGRIDPKGDGDQIVMTSFTGGAHCCTRVQVLDRVGGQWKVLDLGMWDGDGPQWPSVKAPGVQPAFYLSDDRFAYAFTDYADSFMPSRIFEITDGRAVETSQARRYASAFEEDMADAKASCLKHDNPNGACAAYVGDAARLGRRAQAWPVAMANYDKAWEWERGGRCTARKVAGKCPEGHEEAYPDFPAQLEGFLVENGYMKASEATLPTSVPVEPSFSCDKAKSRNLQIVCADRRLVVLDLDVAFAYARALADARDPDAVRRGQEAWIREVANAPADAGAIRAIYQRRLGELERM